jgi:flagellar export protein FliJ
MAFRFRLQTVLRVRHRDFERTTVALAEAQRAVAAASDHRAACANRANAGVSELDTRLRQGLPATQLRTAAAGVEQLAAREREAIGQVRRARSGVSRATQEVMRARARVRALELLRERQALEHRREYERRQRREFDEVAARVAAAGDPQW